MGPRSFESAAPTIPIMKPEVQRLVDRADACHREMALEYYSAFAGLQDNLDTEAIQQRFFQIVKGDAPDLHGWLQYLSTPEPATSGAAKGR